MQCGSDKRLVSLSDMKYENHLDLPVELETKHR